MSKIYIDLGNGGFNIFVDKLNKKENAEVPNRLITPNFVYLLL